MIQEDKILTLHPQGKKGVNISRKKYDFIRSFILDTIEKHREITYQDLNDLAEEHLANQFDGSIPWYIVSVKLDLEARGIIERIPKTSPHQLRLATSS